jgi:hypothetical protein
MMVRNAVLAGLLLVALAFGAARAEERITDYDIRAVVQENADIVVTETIRVISEGDQIKRGIYRDLPAVQTTIAGLFDLIDYDVIEVRRDGEPEPYFVVPEGEFTRIYMGRADRFLDPGAHIYQLTYRVGGQIRFSDRADELYWNLTGANWAFPIERVSAEIVLPDGAEILDVSGYTGGFGETGADYEILNRAETQVSLRGTRRLESGEGVTISVSWKPGLMTSPNVGDSIRELFGDNPGAVLGLVGLMAIGGFFWSAWRRVGRDPQKGPIIPLFEPPEGLSAAAVGYIHARGFNDGMAPGRALTVGVMSLAVKGLITIEDLNKRSGTRYILRRTDKPDSDLPPGERELLKSLFSGTDKDEVHLGTKFAPKLAAAKAAYMKTVSAEYSTNYFRRNAGTWFLGAAFVPVVSIASAVLNAPGGEDGMILAGAMTVFFCAVLGLFFWALRHCLGRFRFLSATGGVKPFLVAVAILIAAFVPVGLFGIGIANTASPPVVLMIGAMVGLAFVFFDLLDAPTVKGRAIMDQIEGYMLFMTTVEWDRGRAHGDMPPPTIAMFEKHLPYSIALGVDDAWSDTFAKYAEAASIPIETTTSSWYKSHDRGVGRPMDFSKTVSSGMVTVLASASTRPSSSKSGSSGGGSSGGGSGGGGGGGW